MELFKLLGTIAIDNSDANNAIDNTTGNAVKSESKISSAFKKIGVAVAAFFSVQKITEFGKECLSMASDVEEMQNKFDVVFKGMTGEVEEWADTYASSIGRNKNVIKEYLADNQNMFVGMGMTRDAGAELSEKMVQLGLDLASFNNLQEDEAVNALSKALMGESESAKRLGAVLNENTIAMAMNEMGIRGKFDALSESEKMEVRYQAILMQSTDAIGDCERSLDSYKGRQIQLQSAMEQIKETIGGMILPLATLGTSFLVEGAGKLQTFIDTMQNADERAKLFNTAISNCFSQDFIDSMSEWIPYLRDVVGIFAQDTIDKFADKLGNLKIMFSTLKDVLQPIVETYLNGLVTKFDTAVVFWGDVLLPTISFITDAFIQLATTIGTAISPAIDKISVSIQEFQQFVSAAYQNYIYPMIISFIEMIQQLWVENEDKINKIGELFRVIFNNIANNVAFFVGVFKNYIYPFLGWLCSVVQENMGIVKAVFQSAFDIIGGIVDFFIALFEGDWQGMWSAILRILQSGIDLMMNCFNLLSAFIAAIGQKLYELLVQAFENIKNAIAQKISEALNFVVEKFNALPDPIRNALSVVLGIVYLIVSSIVEKIQSTYTSIQICFNLIKDFISSVMNAIWSKIVNVWETIKAATVGKLSSMVSDVQAKFQSIVDGITEKMDFAKNAVSSAIEAIKGFFNFEWHLPELKLPHIKIDGEWDLSNGTFPSFGVDWYAKGAVLNRPTVFGMNGTNAMVGGESGAEAVAPIDVLQGYVAEAVASQNAGIIDALQKILVAILSMDDGMSESFADAIKNMRFDINNREFARLVKAVN